MNPATITFPATSLANGIIQPGKTLVELEAVIERGLQTFVEVGAALKEISEKRLYQEQRFLTFEDYCRGRWGWSRKTVYQYIQANEVVENVQTSGQIPANVGQAALLAPLEPEQQREVASRVDFANTTVRELKVVVKQIRHPEQTATETKPAAKPTPIVTNREIRHAARSKADFEKMIAKAVKRYESRHAKIGTIIIIHTQAGGIKVEMWECSK